MRETLQCGAIFADSDEKAAPCSSNVPAKAVRPSNDRRKLRKRSLFFRTFGFR